MYPRNAASPPRIAVGAIYVTATGALVTSGASVTVRPEGGAEGAGGGTLDYGASGMIYYTPTQAETNYTAFCVTVYKASCTIVGVTIVTTASSTSGTVDAVKIDGDATAAAILKAYLLTIVTGTAQAGGASTITLAAGASSANDYYAGEVIYITAGTGAGQYRRIDSYVGSTKVATVDSAWATQPDNTSVYQLQGRIVS